MKLFKKKEVRIAPAVTGTLTCERRHQCNVVDLNVMRVTTLCSTCGISITIRESLKGKNERSNSIVTQ